jgi:hypothetical protein
MLFLISFHIKRQQIIKPLSTAITEGSFPRKFIPLVKLFKGIYKEQN